jgi:predicted DCC family thiol-disulfide oxidoreductase YuxK
LRDSDYQICAAAYLMPLDTASPIILYDGVCGFCNRTVQFILKRDSNDRFRFATLQSEFARTHLQKHGLTTDNLDTLYLIKDSGQPTELVLDRSTAAIAIYRELGMFWRIVANFYAVLPKRIRDWGYNLIARNRYRIFGKYDTCPLPKTSDRHKFLEVN